MINESLLENYQALVLKVEDLARDISTRFTAHIACRPGCHSCCRHLSLFPVEAAMLAVGLKTLPADAFTKVRDKVSSGTENDTCPLLADGLCALYDYRPLICRTHGLPILLQQGPPPVVDYCPLNFGDAESIPGDAVINIERLNLILASINAVFLKQLPPDHPGGNVRISIAGALLLDW